MEGNTYSSAVPLNHLNSLVFPLSGAPGCHRMCADAESCLSWVGVVHRVVQDVEANLELV